MSFTGRTVSRRNGSQGTLQGISPGKDDLLKHKSLSSHLDETALSGVYTIFYFNQARLFYGAGE